MFKNLDSSDVSIRKLFKAHKTLHSLTMIVEVEFIL